MITFLAQLAVVKLALSVVLALLAFVTQRAINRSHVSHALWLLVLITMLVPAVVELAILDVSSLAQDTSTSTFTNGATLSAASPLIGSAQSTGALLTGRIVPRSLPVLAALIWIVGSIGVLVLSLARALRFHHALARASKDAPESLRRHASELAAAMGLRRTPSILLADARVSPLVWWRRGAPCVVLPSALLDELDADQLRLMLAHELAHVRRGDHAVRVVEWVAGVVFWWNPVTWWARRNLRQAEEMCCDAHVISAMHVTPRGYAGALLAVVDFLSVPPLLPAPAFAMRAASGGRTNLERRIRMIISGRSIATSPRRVRAIAGALAAALLPLGLVNFGARQPEPQELPKQSAVQARVCDELALRVRAEVEAGIRSAAEGQELILRCIQRAVATQAELEQMATKKNQARQESSLGAVQKSEKVKEKLQMDSVLAARKKLEAEKRSGAESALNAQRQDAVRKQEVDKATYLEQLKLLQQREKQRADVETGAYAEAKARLVTAGKAAEKAASVKMTQADCQKIAIEIRAAVNAGKVTAEEALEKLLAACGG